MKLDYTYIKRLLTTMEEYPGHEIESYKFWELIGLFDSEKNYSNEMLDKFIGHMKILTDECFIESSSNNFGLILNRGQLFTSTAKYRITARGYEFLDILKNDTVFNKIKSFALSNAYEIGKKIIIELSSKMMTGGYIDGKK